MDPTVQAAWIAAGAGVVGVISTAAVGIAGYRNTSNATDKTVNAGHDERVWDRKADAYQDALAASLWRNHRRIYLTTTDLTEEQYAEEANALFQMQTDQDWWAMQGRLGTFGAPAVVQAYNVSLLATESAHRRHDEWRQTRKTVQDEREGRGSVANGVDQHVLAAAAALSAFKLAMANALEADYALEAAIRRDLDPNYAGSVDGRQIFTKLNTNAISSPSTGEGR